MVSGLSAEHGDAPWVVEQFGPLGKADENRFWYLDFHWPRGLTPLGTVWHQDGYAWATQLAAQNLPLPHTRGMVARMVGTHTYAAEILVDSDDEIRLRRDRVGAALPGLLRDFDSLWATRRGEINADWSALRHTDFAAMSNVELVRYLHRARAHNKRAFEIHFEIMYPLVANYVAFHTLCIELGVDPAEIGKFLQGYDTVIMQTDRQLWELTVAARDAGLADIFAATPPEKLHAALAGAGEPGARWLRRFDEFLQQFGWRTEGIADVALPSWVEDPTSPLGTIQTFLAKGGRHDFDAARAAAINERESAIDAARSTLTRQEQRRFDAALTACQAANFAWWNEEHDFYIDLRSMLPLRWGALATAEHAEADRADDTMFLFWPELLNVASGTVSMRSLRGLVEDRRQYCEYWRARRPSMPKVLGTVPDKVFDPMLIEVFGLNREFLATVSQPHGRRGLQALTGVAAARGVARGPARVLHDADDLYRIQPGDVLVCESTSPNWTPAFAKLAGCVCDCGGTLSHAAIVGREYGVPTVVAVGIATITIRDNDDVEVDGTTGRVWIHRTSREETP